jgi:hypothetical protein
VSLPAIEPSCNKNMMISVAKSFLLPQEKNSVLIEEGCLVNAKVSVHHDEVVRIMSWRSGLHYHDPSKAKVRASCEVKASE